MDVAYLDLGLRHVKAVAVTEQAYENREDALMWANVNFLFDPLREYPGFRSLLSDLGFG